MQLFPSRVEEWGDWGEGGGQTPKQFSVPEEAKDKVKVRRVRGLLHQGAHFSGRAVIWVAFLTSVLPFVTPWRARTRTLFAAGLKSFPAGGITGSPCCRDADLAITLNSLCVPAKCNIRNISGPILNPIAGAILS